MIAYPAATCPSVDELSHLLEPHPPATPALDRHLDDCARCRDLLCYLAGEPEWWEEASAVLATPPPAARLAPAICALSSAPSETCPDDPLCDHELKQLQALLEPASHPELIGRIGRYEIEQLIGRGGMGLVFRARDVELQRVVAVKTLAIHLIPVGAARNRFVREARATASLTHPHIVPLYDVITDGAVPAIVMQLIAGPTLQQKLAQDGPLAWRDVLQIGVQLSEALATAHAHGLVHRDIKPGNVLLEADGTRALLTDFGLVRALDDATLTRSGMLAGTPDYMSPEQAQGQTVSTSSDLFSLGSLLYAMLTGHPPFRAESPMAIMNRICHQRHRSLGEVRPEVPLELARLIDRLLAKVPRKRFSSASEVSERLRELSGARQRLRSSRRPVRKIAFMAAPLLLLALAFPVARQAFLDAPDLSQRELAGESASAAGAAALEDDLVESMSHNKTTADSSGGVDSPEALEIGNAGFVELQQLDQQIEQLDYDTAQLHDPRSTATRENIVQPLPWSAAFDQDIEKLQIQQQRLTDELRSRP